MEETNISKQFERHTTIFNKKKSSNFIKTIKNFVKHSKKQGK